MIYKWLVQNDRLLDKKYLIGESYGGYRGPLMTHYLQSTLGVAMNGAGAGQSISEPGERRWGAIADSLDDRPAVDYGRTSGVRRQAD